MIKGCVVGVKPNRITYYECVALVEIDPGYAEACPGVGELHEADERADAAYDIEAEGGL
ncbi:MAG: hypothetical protein IMZ50_16445 [Candidatus Atribacteria bacterium]|nr:hypothetical protein [Candidatus Atribacteria bacterium]